MAEFPAAAAEIFEANVFALTAAAPLQYRKFGGKFEPSVPRVPLPAPRVLVIVVVESPLMWMALPSLVSKASAFAVVPGVIAVMVTRLAADVAVTSGSTPHAPLEQVPWIALTRFVASVVVLSVS